LAPRWLLVPYCRRRWPFETGTHPVVSHGPLCLAAPAFDRPDVSKLLPSLTPKVARNYRNHSLHPVLPLDRKCAILFDFPWHPCRRGGFCSGSSNGEDPDSAILVCTIPYGDANAHVVNGRLLVYDPVHLAADGSLKVLWDSQKFGSRFFSTSLILR
jgi:hypothetical protein